MVVYADVLVAVNWWIDFLLLTGVARIGGVAVKVWRIVIGALVGGLFSLVLLLPPLSAWLTIGLKFIAAAIMTLISFGWHRRRRFIKMLLLLFGVSSGLAGLCSALYFYVAPSRLYVFNGMVYYDISPWLLIGLTVLCYGILTGIEHIGRRRAPRDTMYTVTVLHHNRSVTVRCLYDSGNHLVEPFSNRPVMVVEKMALDGLLELPKNDMELPFNGEWRLIPFGSIGGDGVLPAFMPEKVMVSNIVLPACYVAICERLGQGEYQGLIGTALGDALECAGGV